MATKRKHSIFCTKNPTTGVAFAAVFIKNENTWVLARGKIYQNGYFRYIHNGKEAKVGPYNWRSLKGCSYEQMDAEIVYLNVGMFVFKT